MCHLVCAGTLVIAKCNSFHILVWWLVLQRSGLAKEHGLDEEKLASVLFTLENGYHSANSYHNRCLSCGIQAWLHVSETLPCLREPTVLTETPLTQLLSQIVPFMKSVALHHDCGPTS